MQRILVSLSIIGVVAAFVIGGTIAYFHDVEVAEQEFVIGTLDLTVDGGNVVVYIVDIDDITPGSYSVGDTRIVNIGTLAGELDIAVGTIVNVGGAGDTEYEDGYGHLGANLKMVFWIDTDQEGDFDDGDLELLNDGTVDVFDDTDNPYLTYVIANTYSGDSWDAVQTMGGGAFDDFRISWNIPTTVGNTIQGDSMSFDVTFTLEQAARD